MQSGKASGLRPPSKIAKPSSIAGSTSDLNTSRSASPSVGGVLTENTDDFIVGNRVWVGGTKPGYIQFIGETKFAPGEWAGVVLDEPIGKNDGTLAGVKYFQCEPKRGVFSRLTKLTREPLMHLMTDGGLDTTLASPLSRSASPKPMSTSRASLAVSRSSTPSLDGMLHVGDKVTVASASGNKIGILRFLGATEFAAGEWAGVELDEPIGKNDGSVSDKRYFTCAMKHGLFAPIAKISKYRRPSATKAVAPLPTPKKVGATPRRVGSQESVNTIGSATSSRSIASKPRLGVNALTTSSKPTRVGPSVAATHTAMQGALKEKEQHIEQLLRERDLEMADVAKTAAQLEESERTLSIIKAEYLRFKDEADQQINEFKELAETKEAENSQLINQLDEEKRKNEDLLFRLEEEAITRADIESSKNDEDLRMKTLQEEYENERARTEQLERESQLNFQNEEMLVKYSEDMECLQHKLKEYRDTIQKLESKILELGNQSNEVSTELQLKSKQIEELSDVNARLLTDCKRREEETDKAKSEMMQKHDVIINDLKIEITTAKNGVEHLTKELNEKQKNHDELSGKLHLSEEKYLQQKAKFESEIAELLRCSGDNSAQLNRFNEQLRQLEKQLEESQNQRNQVEDELKQKVNQNNEEIEKLEAKHKSQLQNQLTEEEEKWKLILETEKREAKFELEKLKNELQFRLEESKKLVSELEEEKKMSVEARQVGETLVASAEQGLTDVRNELSNLHNQKHDMSQLISSLELTNKQLTAEIELLRGEKEAHSKNLKRLEEKLESFTAVEVHNKQLLKQIEQLNAERETLNVEKNNREEKMELLKGEMERLKGEFVNYQMDLQQKLEESKLDDITVQNLKTHIEMQQSKLEEYHKALQISEEQVDKLNEENTRIPTLVESIKNLELKLRLAEENIHETATKEMQMLKDFENEQDTAHQLAETARMLLEQQSAETQKLQSEIFTLNQELEKKDAICNKTIQISEDQINKLNQEINQIPVLIVTVKDLESKLKTAEEKVAEAATKELQMLRDFEDEKDMAHNLNETSRILLERQSSEVNKLKTEITALIRDINIKDAKLEESLKENSKLSQMEKAPIVTNGNDVDSKLLEEKEALEAQVDFLNSVIVDMQKKVDDYQSRLYLLETGANGHLDTGSDVNLNAIKIPKPPRMFCDICDMFDIHETEDCPRQASSDSPPPTQHHGKRNQERPYCDICEVFGHWTNECDDNETF